MFVHVCVCAHVCVHVCAHMCVCTCVCIPGHPGYMGAAAMVDYCMGIGLSCVHAWEVCH